MDNDNRRYELFGNSQGLLKYKCIQCNGAIDNQTEKRYKECGNYCNKCAWCEKPLSNQTEEKYKQYGNICPRCNVDKSQPSMTALEIIRTKKLIQEHHDNMSLYAEGLEFDISEEERLIIVMKMEDEFNKIKALKYFLCQGEN